MTYIVLIEISNTVMIKSFLLMYKNLGNLYINALVSILATHGYPASCIPNDRQEVRNIIPTAHLHNTHLSTV